MSEFLTPDLTTLLFYIKRKRGTGRLNKLINVTQEGGSGTEIRTQICYDSLILFSFPVRTALFLFLNTGPERLASLRNAQTCMREYAYQLKGILSRFS